MRRTATIVRLLPTDRPNGPPGECRATPAHAPTLDSPAEGTVDLTPVSGNVSMVNLNEEHITDVPRVGNGVPIAARPNEIVSLRFRRE